MMKPKEMDGSSNKPEVISAQREDLKYMQALIVNVSNFVSVKLSGYNNYCVWKAQMLCLIESQMLRHLIDSEIPFPEDKGLHMIPQYNTLVKGWILGSMNENVLKDFVHINSAECLWVKLEYSFSSQVISDTKDEIMEPIEMNGRQLVSALREDLKYMQASNINASNFVSEKLSGRYNYQIWKTQMLCLIESQMLGHIINSEIPYEDMGLHMNSQYNTLVKGWIFGSMNEEVLRRFRGVNLAKELWEMLNFYFKLPVSDVEGNASTDSPGFRFGLESLRVSPEIENIDIMRRRKRLYEAAAEGCWWKAKSILKTDNNAATEVITENGNTILHLAVKMGQNYFTEKLLQFLKDGKDIETKNDKGQTALHIAAMVGNKYAAQLLVRKRKELLEILDINNTSPVLSSIQNLKGFDDTSTLFFLKSALSSGLNPLSAPGHYYNVFPMAINSKEFDLARTLLKKDPRAASYFRLFRFLHLPTDLGFMESLIYPSFSDEIVTGGSLLFHFNIMDKCVDDILRVVNFCNNTCCSCLGNFSMILAVPIAILYPIYQSVFLLFLVLRLTFSLLYVLLWKVLAITFPPIKNIEKKKKEYKEGKEFLSLMCDQLGTEKWLYDKLILEAAYIDAYQVVDEILFRSPDTIKCKNVDGHNIIQLAIINRSEKVYNLVRHIIQHLDSYKAMRDLNGNDLIHLAGRLAPSSVLDRTTGAALQLQRELLWREEVEKLMLPIQPLQENINGETPAMVFTREHKDLLKEGEVWMKTTAESCSITAALIVTIVFAAAITVPGGSKQESGVPMFKKEAAFTVFAVSNAFSLFTGATALLLFLSILTARFSEKDFLISLPRRLIFGLLTLFLSTTAMLVAFGAILFLVFCDQRPWMLAPISAFACLPISVLVTIQLPLLVDLIRSTYFPIFGNQSYLESCKINQRNTIFEE